MLIDLAYDSESFGDYLDRYQKSIRSNCFRSLDSSGRDSIQRLKATGFSVRPIQPPRLSHCGFLARVLDQMVFQRMYWPFSK